MMWVSVLEIFYCGGVRVGYPVFDEMALQVLAVMAERHGHASIRQCYVLLRSDKELRRVVIGEGVSCAERVRDALERLESQGFVRHDRDMHEFVMEEKKVIAVMRQTRRLLNIIESRAAEHQFWMDLGVSDE